MSDPTIKIGADTSDFRNDVSLAASFADRHLKGMADGVKKHSGAATASASASFSSLQRVAEKSAGMMGGAFGDVADVIFDAAGGISESSSAIGSLGVAAGVGAAGLAAVGIAAVGGASAIHSMIMGAEALQARLGEISGSEPLPPEAAAALDDYRQTALGAEAASSGLQVRLAALAADAFEPAMAAAGGLLGRLDDMLPSADALTGTLDTMTNVGRAGVAVFTLGASEAIAYALGLRDLDEDGRAAAEMLTDLAAAATKARQSTGEAVVAIQKDAMLTATGASDAQIGLVKSTDAVDAAVQAYVDTLDLTVESERALADAAFESGQLRKEQLKAAVDLAEAEKRLAESKRERAEADRESAKATAEDAAALRGMQVELAKLAAEDAADSARIRAQMLAGNEAAITAEASAAALAGQAGAIDFSGLASGINGGAGGIAGAALKGLPGMLSGGAGGVLSSLGAAGPVGAAIAAVVALPDLIDGIADTIGGLADMFADLPDALSTALGETLPDIIGDLPDLVTSIVRAVLELPGVIMGALPEIVSELTQLGPQLIADLVTMLAEQLPRMFAEGVEFLLGGGLYGAIARGVWDGLNEVFDDFPQKIADKLGEMLGKVLNPFRDKEGDFLGTNLTAEGGRRIAGWDLPSFDRGTSEITRSGLALVHRGEEIRRKGEGPSRGAAPVINVYGPDTREIVRQIRELLGGDHGTGYGLGDSLP